MLILTTISIQQPVTAKNCHDLEFIFARGSGSILNDQDYQAFYHAFHNVTKDLGLNTHFYELGSTNINGVQYPAVTIANPFYAIGAFVSAGQAYQYGKSVNLGVEELTTYITKTLQSCPRTQFILGGSQGAQVISQALPKLNPRHIYAATFVILNFIYQKARAYSRCLSRHKLPIIVLMYPIVAPMKVSCAV